MSLRDYTFRPKFIQSLLTAFVLALLCTLGYWQLNRSKQKEQILLQFRQQLAARPLEHAQLNSLTEEMQFHPIHITGVYDNAHTLLLDNRFHAHQVGYEVLTPLQIEEAIVLVNRGWIPRPFSRAQLPELDDVIGLQSLFGYVYFPSHKPFTLSNKDENNHYWPKIIQTVDFEYLRPLFNYHILPFTIRLDIDETNGFVRQWDTVTLSPSEHIAYAVQWFALAGILLIIYLVLSIRSVKSK